MKRFDDEIGAAHLVQINIRNFLIININRFFGIFRRFFIKKRVFFVHVPFAFEVDVVLPAAEAIESRGYKAIFVASKNDKEAFETGQYSKINRIDLSAREVFLASGHVICDTQSVHRDFSLQFLAGNINYIPYGVSISAANYSKRVQYGLLIHKLAKYIFVPSKLVGDRFVKFGKINRSKVVCSSHPKADLVYCRTKKNKRSPVETIRILYACHYSKEWGSFNCVVETLLNFLDKNKRVEVCFRPHPFFDWSYWCIPKETERRWLQATKTRRIIIDTEADYPSQLANADILLVDGSSVLYDFFQTRRPIVHVRTKENYPMLREELNFLEENHKVCELPGDIYDALDQSINRVTEGFKAPADPLGMARPNTFRETFLRYNFNE